MRAAPVGLFDLDESIVEAMQRMGAPPDAVARAQALAEAAPPEEEAFGVYAENLPSVNAFTDLRTQWRHAGMHGQRMGLDYAGVSAWLDLFIRPRRRRALMADLMVMESAVLKADQEKREKEE